MLSEAESAVDRSSSSEKTFERLFVSGENVYQQVNDITAMSIVPEEGEIFDKTMRRKEQRREGKERRKEKREGRKKRRKEGLLSLLSAALLSAVVQVRGPPANNHGIPLGFVWPIAREFVFSVGAPPLVAVGWGHWVLPQELDQAQDQRALQGPRRRCRRDWQAGYTFFGLVVLAVQLPVVARVVRVVLALGGQLLA